MAFSVLIFSDGFAKYIVIYIMSHNTRNSLTQSAKPAETSPNLRLCFIKKPIAGLAYKNFDRDAKLVFVQ